MRRIIVETGQAAGIPVLTMARDGCENCPVVFFLHNFTADKRAGIPLGYRLFPAT